MREHGGVRTQPRYLLLAGAVAGVTGIAVSHLATTLLNVRATPIQALAELIIAKTPGPIAETLIQIVGRKDKPILVAGVTTGVIVLGALAGLVARRSRLGANLVFLLVGGLMELPVTGGAGRGTRREWRELAAHALGVARVVAAGGWLAWQLGTP